MPNLYGSDLKKDYEMFVKLFRFGFSARLVENLSVLGAFPALFLKTLEEG